MPATGATVGSLASAPVKGLALVAQEAVRVTATGIEDDRAYALVDPKGYMVNGKRIGRLSSIVPKLGHRPDRLGLRFPDGSVVESEVVLGEAVTAVFYGRPRPAREVEGPFSATLSAWADQPLRLVRLDAPNGAIDRAELSASISILSTGSLADLSAVAGTALDARRFRMSVIVDGLAAYGEEAWIGGRLRIGEVVVRPKGGIGRCQVPGMDPDTGFPTTDVLGILKRTRGDVVSTENSPFGIWAAVVEEGIVRVGDSVLVED